MLSIINGVSLWYRPCYKNKLWQWQQMLKTYDNIKADFPWS